MLYGLNIVSCVQLMLTHSRGPATLPQVCALLSLLSCSFSFSVAQYTVYAQFCGYFVDFVEHFVVSCRAPLLGFLWPCLSTIEKQV